MVSAADPTELAEQNLDPGDVAFEDGQTIPLPADPDASFIDGGTPVNFDANGYIEPMDGGDYSAGDEILGIVLDSADESDAIRLTDEKGDDNYYAVHVDRLPVAVEVDGGASVGDLVHADGSGGYTVDNTAGTHPVVKVADDTNNVYVVLME